MGRKDGRPRSLPESTVERICEHDLPIDDYPWAHPNGGRIPLRYGHADFDTWDPRRWYCQDAACYG